jgi:hypothetical protein
VAAGRARGHAGELRGARVQRTGAGAVDAARPRRAAARPRQAAARPRRVAARQRRVGDVAPVGQRRRRLRRARRRSGAAVPRRLHDVAAAVVGKVALFGQRRSRLRRARRRGGRACAGRRKNEEDKWRLVGLEGASMRGARAQRTQRNGRAAQKGPRRRRRGLCEAVRLGVHRPRRAALVVGPPARRKNEVAEHVAAALPALEEVNRRRLHPEELRQRRRSCARGWGQVAT